MINHHKGETAVTMILAAATIGAWSYSGFLAQPAPAPATSTNPPPPGPSLEIQDRPQKSYQVAPDFPVASASRTADPLTGAALQKPVYRMVDASGQVWEHPDPDQLRRFLESRDHPVPSGSTRRVR